MRASIGEIYRVSLRKEDSITPKYGYDSRSKFCVVIATPDFGYYVAYLVVNHEINEKFNPSKVLKDNFFPLSRKDYPDFIKQQYDPSWLDMTKIREMDMTRLDTEGVLIGKLTDSDLAIVIQCLKDSELITIKEKRRCGLMP